MIVTERTLDILKNFALINDGLVIRKGKRLSTIAPGKQLLAVADVETAFPADFAVADLKFLIACLSNMDVPVMDFTASAIVVTEGRKGAKPTRHTIQGTSPELIIHPKIDSEKMPSVDFTFQLEAEDFEDMADTAKKMKYERVEIVGEKGIVTLVVGGRRSSKIGGTSGWTREVGMTPHRFRFTFFTDNWRLIHPDAYTIDLAAEGIAHFIGGIEYWAVVEEDSFFERATTE